MRNCQSPTEAELAGGEEQAAWSLLRRTIAKQAKRGVDPFRYRRPSLEDGPWTSSGQRQDKGR